MACFLAPTAEAVIVSMVKRQQKKKEETALLEASREQSKNAAVEAKEGKIPFSRKLGWLSNMLWGGSFLLAIEHIWHGEIVPWPPFLTAMNNPADILPMLSEIATVGTTMAVLITAVWGMMLAAVHVSETKKDEAVSAETEV